MAHRWAGYFGGLCEAYYHSCGAAEFDFTNVFYPVLRARATHPPPNPFYTHRECLRAFGDSVVQMSQLHGPWIARIDLRDFYPTIGGDVCYKLLDEAGVDPLLVDSVSAFVDPLVHGLPQGYATSDMVARLVLTPYDRRLRDLHLPFMRWQDDILIFAWSRAEAEASTEKAIANVSPLLNVNRDKVHIEPPRNLEFVRRFVFWEGVEWWQYGTPEFEGVDPTGGYPDTFSALVHGLDYLGMYRHEFDPTLAPQSVHGTKLCLRHVAEDHPNELVSDASAHGNLRPSNGPLFLPYLSSDQGRRASYSFSKALRGVDSGPDSRVRVLECLVDSSSRGREFQAAFAGKVLPTLTSAALRNSVYSMCLKATYEHIEACFPLNPWIDEGAALAAATECSDWKPRGPTKRMLDRRGYGFLLEK